MPLLTPTSDSTIARRYSIGTLEQKVQNKTALQEQWGWPPEPRRPMLCFPAGMSDALGGALLRDVLPGILTLPLEILVVGNGSAEYGALFTKLSREHGHRVRILPDAAENQSQMLSASDMALFLADPVHLEELSSCLHYGVVPIAPACSALEDYDPVQECGTGFLYQPSGMWQCFAALARAVETYRFPFDWRTIQRHCMESVQRC